MRPYAWALLAAMVASGCQDDVQCICTAVHERVDVLVLDENGLPATGVELSVVQVRSGEALSVQQDMYEPGRYVVVSDDNRAQVSPAGERLRVSGSRGGQSVPRFEAEFVVRVDSPCACHVEKVDGPESVRLAFPPD